MSDNNMILSAVLYFNISCECVSGAECVHKLYIHPVLSGQWVTDGSYAL